MQRFRLSPVDQQRVAVLVPLIALAISLFLVYPAWGHYDELQTQLEGKRKELAALKAAAPPPPGPTRPLAEDRATEPSEFLGLITQLAYNSDCTLIGLDVAAIQKPKEEGTEKDADKGASDMHPLRSRVEIEGSYPGIRQFLSQLSSAPRLLVVTDMSLSSTATDTRIGVPVLAHGSVHATIEIERYVAPIKLPPINSLPGAKSRVAASSAAPGS